MIPTDIVVDKDVMIVRMDGNDKPDIQHSNYLAYDNGIQDFKLNVEELKKNLDDSRFAFWLEMSLKYAISIHNSVRGQGSSDVIMLMSQENFESIWNKTLPNTGKI